MFRRIPPVTAPPGGVPPGSGGSRIFWQVPQTGLSGNVCLFLLRIPLLFVMDRVLLDGLGLFPVYARHATLAEKVASTAPAPLLFPAFSVNLFSFTFALILVILPMQQLFQVYVHALLVCFYAFSQYLHHKVADIIPPTFEREESGRRLLEALVKFDWDTINTMENAWRPVAIHALLYVAQTVLGTLFFVCYFQRESMCSSTTSKPTTFFLWFPCFIAMFLGEPGMSQPFREGHFYNWLASIIIPISFLTHFAYTRIPVATEAFSETLSDWHLHAMNLGVHTLLEQQWTRLAVPTVLRTFWLIRTTLVAVEFLYSDEPKKTEMQIIEDLDSSNSFHQGDDMTAYDGEYSDSMWFLFAKEVLSRGCDSLIAVLGLSAIVSSICHEIGYVFQAVLGTYGDEERNTGTVTAILFFILALQTGITGLDYEKRFVRLCRNFCLLLTALFHFVHTMLEPVLMTLSAAPRVVSSRHIRALVVAGLLFWVPLLLLILFWTTQSPSTWLFAVSAFSLEVVVKVMISLSLYALFLFHARQEVAWESLDDYVYYIRAVGNTVEFLFGIFLFLNGAWILLFESGGAIRAVMMCIHAYFNIWCEARAGWQTFLKRRTAVSKINSLKNASPKKLEEVDDICAICYQMMTQAKVTRCGHLFHGMCLRKWLYIQDKCPLCLEIPHFVEAPEDEQPNPGEGELLPQNGLHQARVQHHHR